MNPKIATLVPVKHLNLIADDQYFMALSHMVSNDLYAEFFYQRSRLGMRVTLDNSAVELGNPESFDDYIDKAAQIGADIMLPDFFQDAEKTIDAARKHMPTVQARGFGVNVMVIPQGKTVLDWLLCASNLCKIVDSYGITPVLGISCRYTDLLGGSRLPLVFAVKEPKWARHIIFSRMHFLGCYADPRLEIWPLFNQNVFQGVDSSFPCVYARHGILLTPNLFHMPRPDRKIDFENDVYPEELLAHNIKVWRTACSQGYDE